MMRTGTNADMRGNHPRRFASTFHPLKRRPRVWPFGEQYAFGIYIAGAVVTVYPGSIEAGGTYYTTSETPITITADGQYIGIALDRSTGAATITGPHNSRPVPSGDTWAGALYSFGFVDSVVTSWHDHIHDIRLDAVI